MAAGLLSDVRILEWAHGLAGSVAALLLAEAGADVVKVEAADGEAARGRASFAVWNRSKRSVRLDPAQTADRADFDRLLAGADIFVTDRTPETLAALGLDGETLQARRPDLIFVQIGAWPAGHPLENRPVDDVLMLAESGLMDEQRGVRDGPIYLRFPLGSWGAAYLAANGAAAALVAREKGRRTRPIRTSLLQGALAPTGMFWNRAERPTPGLVPGMSKQSRSPQFECGDGVWLHIKAPGPDNAPLMKAALEAMGRKEVARLNAAAWQGGRNAPNFGANQVIFKTRPSGEWLADLWASDVPVQPDLPLGQLYFDEQALANGYVVDVEDARLGRTRQPGPPITIDPPARVKSAVPALGEHHEEVLAAWTPRADLGLLDYAGGPLDGVKVLDCGAFLAGPLAPMLMADLGAEVIKLEGVTGDPMRLVDGAFTSCQRGKRSVALQLKSPDSRPLLHALVRWADVLHHNHRLQAADKLGLGYDELRAVNAGLVYCHVSSYGPVGPRKDWPGYDQLFQAQSGWEYEGAGEGNPPMWHRFGMMDHQCAMASLLATLLALRNRARTGHGQAVGASLLGASLLTVSETVVLEDGSLAPFPRLDSRQMGVSPARRLYRCGDGWLAVLAEGEGVLEALVAAVGAGDVPGLEGAFAALSAADARARVESVGGQAGQARENNMQAFFDDPANRALGLIAQFEHPTYGRFEQVGAFWSVGGAPLLSGRAPPCLAEGAAEILRELGIDDSRAAELAARQVIALPSLSPC